MVRTSRSGTALSVLGFTPDQDDVYRVLLRSPEISSDRLAELTGMSERDLEQCLMGLDAAGLVEIGDGVVSAVSPDHALGRLIADESHRLQSATDQLESLRSMLPSLMADHLSSRAPTGTPVMVEVVEGDDVVGLLRSLSAGSTGELLWLLPDQWHLDLSREIDDWVVQLIRSGRRSRAIYPARVLEEAPDMVRARAEAGEQVRILASLPSRVAILGTSAALIPQRWGESPGPRLVVRQHAMIGALRELFERLWERGMAVPGLDGQRGSDASRDRRLLLDQLARGAKDEQVARALGLSLRTVRRRVAEILEELGVDSRFQAGVEAVRRGWI
jgi:sugar-specific transcriptional regulator TrmB